jgi:hypothetical protein
MGAAARSGAARDRPTATLSGAGGGQGPSVPSRGQAVIGRGTARKTLIHTYLPHTTR